MVSDGSIGENSPFTTAFVDFLENNNKDMVAVSELVQYVKMKVADETEQTPMGNPLSTKVTTRM